MHLNISKENVLPKKEKDLVAEKMAPKYNIKLFISQKLNAYDALEDS